MRYCNQENSFFVYYVVTILFLGLLAIVSIIGTSYSQKAAVNLIPNSDFNQSSGSGTNTTVKNWYVGAKICKTTFICTINSTTGWNDKTSLQISTNATSRPTPSSINSKPINVTAGQGYQLITHMKLNQYATTSHIGVEAYNQTSGKYYQIKRCPSAINGPLEWHQYKCQIAVPITTTKIRLLLYPGWSAQPGKEAVALFDALSLTSAANESSKTNVPLGGFIPAK